MGEANIRWVKQKIYTKSYVLPKIYTKSYVLPHQSYVLPKIYTKSYVLPKIFLKSLKLSCFSEQEGRCPSWGW